MLEKSLTALRITAERERLGISQEQLGEKVGASQQQVNSWEADDPKRTPRAPHIREMARLFAVTTDYLLGLSDARTHAGLRGGDWVIDNAAVKQVERGQWPPGGRYAWQVPESHMVLSDAAYVEFHVKLIGGASGKTPKEGDAKA